MFDVKPRSKHETHFSQESDFRFAVMSTLMITGLSRDVAEASLCGIFYRYGLLESVKVSSLSVSRIS